MSIHRLFPLLALLAASLAAQDWKAATDLPALDMSGLTAVQKSAVLKILREESCACTCGMKVAECRIKDPACSDSRLLASMAAAEMRAGRSPEQVRASLRNSELMKARRASLLGEKVALNTTGAPSTGASRPRITIVEFSDFQCPYCRIAAAKIYDILKMYPNEIRLVFKQFPLDTHSQAELAAQAALAAHAQGKFWPLHDKMFANSKAINKANILTWAKELGLDMTRFAADVESGKYRRQVEQDLNEGRAVGVSGTPTFFINGKQFRAQIEPDLLKPILDEELKNAR
ncbi:MAG: thioredoxin domain-containing protein [Bryobacterales bacterium]|nr:thioredoxin domain-containing protein [Bryobacterales bacterium]